MSVGARNSDARTKLAAPTLAMLPKVADSLSFLYLDLVRVVQDDTGVCAQIETKRGTDTVYLPTAALSCLLLGPGTSITARALSTLARHGTTVVCTGSGGVRAYAGILPDSLTTTWLERQALAWANEGSRLTVAVRMYEQRFGTGVRAPRRRGGDPVPVGEYERIRMCSPPPPGNANRALGGSRQLTALCLTTNARDHGLGRKRVPQSS